MAAHGQFVSPAMIALSASILLGGCNLSSVSSSIPGFATPKPSDTARAAQDKKMADQVLSGLDIPANVFNAMDTNDRIAAAKAQIDALELSRTGAPVTWNNPDTGAHGSVVPGPTYVVNNQECRDYRHTMTVEEQTQEIKGTACRQPDGTWQPLA